MPQNRLKIVGPTVHEVKKYYFSIEEVSYNLRVSESWIMDNIDKIKEPVMHLGTWYISPRDYATLRKLRDEIYRPVIG